MKGDTVELLDTTKLAAQRDLSHRRPYLMWHGDVQDLLAAMPPKPSFDLVVTSPPYNLGKVYEQRKSLDTYLDWQARIIGQIVPHLKPTGSICWQVGNFIDNGQIVPLDIELAPIFRRHGLSLRNRIIWRFGHGLHNRRRFSGRYEVVMWYTKTDNYIFNLDAVGALSKNGNAIGMELRLAA